MHFLLFEEIIFWEFNRIRYFVLLQDNVKFLFVFCCLFRLSFQPIFLFFRCCCFSPSKYLMYCNVIYSHYINSRSSPEIEDYVYFFHPYSSFLIIFDIKMITWHLSTVNLLLCRFKYLVINYWYAQDLVSSTWKF